MVNKIENFPEVAILIFKERFFNYLQEDFGMKVIGHINGGVFIPVYKVKFENKEFAITRTVMRGWYCRCCRRTNCNGSKENLNIWNLRYFR